jgi:hypothetical protein
MTSDKMTSDKMTSDKMTFNQMTLLQTIRHAVIYDNKKFLHQQSNNLL